MAQSNRIVYAQDCFHYEVTFKFRAMCMIQQ